MIRIEVGGAVLAEIRIITNPLWEVFGSLSSLTLGRSAAWPYSEWNRAAERALMNRTGAELVAWFRRLAGPLPSCLTPMPDGTERDLEFELTRVVDALLDATPTDLSHLVAASGSRADEQPAAWARWFSSAVLDYWQLALRPYWAAMRPVLRHEVLVRAHTLATKGSGGLLGDLGIRARWQPPVLELPGCLPSRDLKCTDRLIIVPLIFGSRPTRCVSDGAGTVAVSCQARGAAVLARTPPSAYHTRAPLPGDRLALLLGRGKATVLRCLVVPSTTSDLAEELNMSASTVSQHLGTLLAANVVHKRRMGVRVVYALNRAGLALLEHLDDEAQGAAG